MQRAVAEHRAITKVVKGARKVTVCVPIDRSEKIYTVFYKLKVTWGGGGGVGSRNIFLNSKTVGYTDV